MNKTPNLFLDYEGIFIIVGNPYVGFSAINFNQTVESVSLFIRERSYLNNLRIGLPQK